MTIRVGINGFGRIGRTVLRILMRRADMEIVAINDIFSNEMLAYLFKYDTIMGTLAKEVNYDDHHIIVNGHKIVVTNERDPERIPWQVDVVVESTGVFRTREKLEKHLRAGAKRVLLTVPPEDSIDAMVVMGVNDDSLRPEHRLISNASCTTNCLAPIAKVLDDNFGIETGIMTTVHAYTNDQRLADVPHSDLRRSRAAAENIIPTSTGAARAVGNILPKLKGKLDGMAARVPVSDGSTVDLVIKFKQGVTRQDLNQAVQIAAQGPMQQIIEYCTVPVVSSDIIGNPHSCIFDSLLTQAHGDGYARVIAWYDNEWGYSNRCVDLIAKLHTFDTL